MMLSVYKKIRKALWYISIQHYHNFNGEVYVLRYFRNQSERGLSCLGVLTAFPENLRV